MGAGASAGLAAATVAASDDDLKACLSQLSTENRAKIQSALDQTSDKKAKKAFKEWSASEVTSVLKIFTDFDVDRSGFIEPKELHALCDILGIDVTGDEADLHDLETNIDADGKLGKKEFFAFYTGGSKEEAAKAFADYAYLFAPKEKLKEWSEEEVTSVLNIFIMFDENKSGDIDEKELSALCDLLCIDASVSEADKLAKDGKLDAREFFAFYVGCTKEEAQKVFEDHAALFKA